MIFFWSDTHFGHKNVIRFCNRPYACIEEMEDTLVKAWNLQVTPKDTIYFLGDFGWKLQKRGEAKRVFDRLNGHKHLIVGNHDEDKRNETLALPWLSVNHILYLRAEGMKAVLCHYPLESWKHMHRGTIHVHGHCHGSLRRVIPKRFDVGCDVFKYPAMFTSLWQESLTQEFVPQDGHVAEEELP